MRRILTTCFVVALVGAGVPAVTAAGGARGLRAAQQGLMCQGQQVTLVGTPGDDVGFGTPGADVIAALGGNDTVEGLGGNDVMCGDEGDDILHGDAFDDPSATGVDSVDGGPGQDVVGGGPGNDELIGGSGGCPGWECIDGVNYGTATTGVTVNLGSRTATGEGTDRLTGIESLGGSNHADTLTGDDGFNLLIGFNGNDTLNGGNGFDFVANFNAATIDLSQGTASGDGSDTLTNIEGAFGSPLAPNADTLIGDDNPNIFDGSLGNDTMRGGGGNDYFIGGSGNDTIDGGPGNLDAIDYLSLGRKIVADLAGGTVRKGSETDQVTGVEAVGGGNKDDALRGTNGVDLFFGEGGNDLIVARGGNDEMDGGRGRDRLDGGSGKDAWWRAETKKRCERHRRPKPPPLEAVANRARHR
jgi:Ca2+-binding RTX toxin-like protein